MTSRSINLALVSSRDRFCTATQVPALRICSRHRDKAHAARCLWPRDAGPLPRPDRKRRQAMLASPSPAIIGRMYRFFPRGSGTTCRGATGAAPAGGPPPGGEPAPGPDGDKD